MTQVKKLTADFYSGEDVVSISRELLGKVLVTNMFCSTRQQHVITGGIITETEAYCGPEDKASHAYGNRRTKRTETMFAAGGVAYVYLCYGIHHLFNIITGPQDVPHAVLIRAIKPLIGIEQMLLRRKQLSLKPNLAAGPGSLSAALGITTIHDQTDLMGEQIYVENHGLVVNSEQIVASPRVGIAYAQDYVDKPWRFNLSPTAQILHNPI